MYDHGDPPPLVHGAFDHVGRGAGHGAVHQPVLFGAEHAGEPAPVSSGRVRPVAVQPMLADVHTEPPQPDGEFVVVDVAIGGHIAGQAGSRGHTSVPSCPWLLSEGRYRPNPHRTISTNRRGHAAADSHRFAHIFLSRGGLLHSSRGNS